MKSLSQILLIAIASISCNNGSQYDDSTQSTTDEVLDAFKLYRSHLDKAEYEEAIKYYVSNSNFTWYENGFLQYNSSDEVLKALKQLDNYGEVSTEFEKTEVQLLGGDHAFLTTYYETTVVQDTVQSFTFSGVMTMILEKKQDRWKIRTGHTSTAIENEWE